MIIGNNNPYSKPNKFTHNHSNNNSKNSTAYLNSMQYSDATNRKEMADKSFAMLQERYKNGLISLEEFNKKCVELNKFRKK